LLIRQKWVAGENWWREYCATASGEAKSQRKWQQPGKKDKLGKITIERCVGRWPSIQIMM
jgi:hypothetical protein